MAPLQLLSQYSADPKAQITERVYQHAMQNLSKTNNELLICGKVQDVIGQANVTKLHQRFSADQRCPVNVVWDVSINCVRMIPLPEDESELNVQTFHTLSKEVHQAVYQGDSRMPETSPKIPRPPNSFILYRQSRHKEVTAANPGVPNTEISRIIAQMWRQETEQVRAHWTEMADRLRQQHVNEHPDYRYSPRRPNQINRRRTRVPAGSVAHLIANTSAGEQRLRVARQFPNNEIRNLDTAFVESLENGISLYGPNGVGPQLVTATDDFYQILQDQIDRIPLEPVQFGALDDPEFPEELPIDELLNLPGAN